MYTMFMHIPADDAHVVESCYTRHIWQFVFIRVQCPHQCPDITFRTLKFGSFWGQCPASLPDPRAHWGAHWSKRPTNLGTMRLQHVCLYVVLLDLGVHWGGALEKQIRAHWNKTTRGRTGGRTVVTFSGRTVGTHESALAGALAAHWNQMSAFPAKG